MRIFDTHYIIILTAFCIIKRIIVSCSIDFMLKKKVNTHELRNNEVTINYLPRFDVSYLGLFFNNLFHTYNDLI